MMLQFKPAHFIPMACLAIFILALAAIPSVAPPSAAELAEVGIGYVKADKVPMAKECFAEALQKDPVNFRANFGAGNLALDENQLGIAQAELATAAKTDPRNAEVAISLGVAYQKAGQTQQANDAYLQAIKIDPTNPKPVYNLAFLNMQLAKYPQARGYLQQYLKLAPNASNKADVLARLAQLDAVLKKKS